jgi:hypothetical protein
MHKYNGTYYFSYSTGDTHFIITRREIAYGPFRSAARCSSRSSMANHHSIVEFRGIASSTDAQLSDGQCLRNIKVTKLKYGRTDRSRRWGVQK